MINFEALFKISYGLYIVSAGDNLKKNGFISNSVFQVTAEPPKFAVCCHKDNYTAGFIKKQGLFSISVLSKETDKKLIGTFGYRTGRDINKFDKVEYKTGQNGVPVVIEDTIAVIECKLRQTIDVGTHLIFIGEVVASEIINESSEPLTYVYYRKVKKGIAPKNAPTYFNKSKLMKDNQTLTASKYECSVCGFIYDPEKGDPDSGIKPGTPFEDLPDDWKCPECGAAKEDFVKLTN